MAGYIGTTPVPQATQHRESFTATGGQTSFATAGYTPQFIDVYLNGVKLAPADYTATNGSDVVLASGATASDILEIVAYTPFEVANQTFTGDTSVTNLAVTGTFTSRGIDDNADAVAITIDSSENVGIGTTSTANIFNVHQSDTSSNSYLHVTHVDSGTGASNGLSIGLESNGTDAAFRNRESGSIKLYTANTERMRIDSSGNLLVGKTTIATGTAGIALRSNGEVRGTANGDYAARFSRLSSDGAIVGFEKDNVAVGSIGIQTGGLTIDGEINHTGLMFAGASVLPRDNSANTDGTIDLGTTDGRWKDLYLSGTARTGLNIHLQDGGTTRGKIELNASDTDDLDIKAVSLGSNMKFFTVDAERMRLDSSGNLLVGKTSSNSNTVGIELTSSDLIRVARSGGATAYLNRKTNDGDIITFAKDGTTVGSIMSYFGDMVTGTGDVGIRWEDGGDLLTPWNPSTNLPRPSAIDLGATSVPFKDLYLSGGVYLGGTGSANKLEDYEEGTWTPTISTPSANVTYSGQNGHYTKIGREVFLNWQINLSGLTSVGTGNFSIGGLPFTQASAKNYGRYIIQTYYVNVDSNAIGIYAYAAGGTNIGVLYSYDNGGWSVATSSSFNISGSTVMSGSLHYIAS